MKTLICLLFAAAAPLSAAAPLPKIIAHRGASHDAPENTLAAFRMAWEQGADGAEGDFYLTPDQRVVCIHDKTTKRTTGAELVVTETSYTELAKLDAGSWKGDAFKGERIPVLEDVLDAVPAGKYFFLEIKDGPRIVEPIAKILTEKKADVEKVVLISFNAEVVKACRAKLPQFTSCLITSLKEFDKPGRPEAELSALEESGAQGLLFKATAPVTPEWFAKAKAGDRWMFCWNVDEAELGRRMIALGVDFMGSNRPGFVRAELSK